MTLIETRSDPLLVLLSVTVAIFASYVALNIAHSVTQAKGRSQALWLAAGALAMGVGIWSMHFIGMLAFEMPGMTMAYDVPLLILSVLVAIGASALALFIVSRSAVPPGSIMAGGVAMAAAIAGMHYIGMYSMRMNAVIKWDIFLIVLSVVIALAASFGALFILIRLRDKADRFGELLFASTLMGAAISGMHYTGMFAATFIHIADHDKAIESSNLIVSSGLTFTVIATTMLILCLALATSIGQRLWSIRVRTADLILGKSEERFRRLVAAVKDYAIVSLDLNGLITTWNQGGSHITGYSEEEVLGRHVSMFYLQEDIEKDTAAEELMIAKKSGHFETEGQRARKDGTFFWANVIINPLYDHNGNHYGYSKVTRDITQVKLAEKRMLQVQEELEHRVRARTHALGQREQQLRFITNALPVLIAQFDTEERFLFANEAFEKWLRLSGKLVGKTLREVIDDEQFELSRTLIKRALRGEVTNYEREAKSGEAVVIFNVTLVPEFGEKNAKKTVIGFIMVATDITRHKEIQSELERAKEAAEAANATKSAFLANMSHEIRTPLGAVLGFSELLLDADMGPSERQDHVEVIKRNGRLLSNIINDILDLSKVEAGKLQIEKISVPFSEVMKEIGSVLSLEANAKGLDLRVTCESIVPNQIKTDPLRLRQILLNIVGNAIKFTSRGTVEVIVKLLPADDGSPRLAFQVKDTGEGIRSDQIPLLFTPFSQADVSTTRKFGGTGLGLTLSKKLANILGGDVVLNESIPGKGSLFTITIDPGVPEQIIFQNTELVESNVMPFTKKKIEIDFNLLKILVVDDSPDNLALVRKILSVAGAEVDTANNGKEAVLKAQEDNYNVILMDLQMPEMDGYEATRILRANGYGKPIVALTAHAMREERQRSLSHGFNDHLVKPIDHALLLKTVAEFSDPSSTFNQEFSGDHVYKPEH